MNASFTSRCAVHFISFFAPLLFFTICLFYYKSEPFFKDDNLLQKRLKPLSMLFIDSLFISVVYWVWFKISLKIDWLVLQHQIEFQSILGKDKWEEILARLLKTKLSLTKSSFLILLPKLGHSFEKLFISNSFFVINLIFRLSNI